MAITIERNEGELDVEGNLNVDDETLFRPRKIDPVKP